MAITIIPSYNALGNANSKLIKLYLRLMYSGNLADIVQGDSTARQNIVIPKVNTTFDELMIDMIRKMPGCQLYGSRRIKDNHFLDILRYSFYFLPVLSLCFLIYFCICKCYWHPLSLAFRRNRLFVRSVQK